MIKQKRHSVVPFARLSSASCAKLQIGGLRWLVHLLGKKDGKMMRDRALASPAKNPMVLCCVCEKKAVYLHPVAPLCWWCCRTFAEAEGKSVMEVVADSTYSDLEVWILREFMARVTAVRPLLARKVERLLQNIDGLSVADAERFASFTPMECQFLLSRLQEITDASRGVSA
jgi:hypothetical protein